MKKFLVILFSIFYFLTYASIASAKADLSISETDITFSKENIVAGDLVKVYARVFNVGDTDVAGFVVFSTSNKEMAPPQTISIRPNTYDDVFIDWKAVAGTFTIQARLAGTNPKDEAAENNIVLKKDIFVDTDANKNGLGDNQEKPKIVENPVQEKSSDLSHNENSLPLPPSVVQDLQTFQDQNPIKSGIEAINKFAGQQADKLRGLGWGNSNEASDTKNSWQNQFTAWTAGAMDMGRKIVSEENRNYLYLGIVVFMLLIILFWIMKKWKNHQV